MPYSAREDDTGDQYTYPESTVLQTTGDELVRKSTQPKELEDKLRKEQEMQEIADLIRRAQLSTNNAVVIAEKHREK